MDKPAESCRLSALYRIFLLAIFLIVISEWFALPQYRALSRMIKFRVVPESAPVPFTSSESFSRDSSQPRSEGYQHEKHSRSQLPAADGSLLLEALQKTRRMVTEGVMEKISDKEREEWQSRNPCASRLELPIMFNERKHVNHLPANPAWDQVMEEYSELHRACTKKIPDITRYYRERQDIPGCKFLITDPAEGTGMGNKVLVLASAFLYAISTQRILLLATRSLLPDNTCEPFMGSSWLIRSDFPLPRYNGHGWFGFDLSGWKDDEEFFREIDEHVKQFGRNASSNLAAQKSLSVFESYKDENATFPWRSQDYAVVGSPELTHDYQPLSRFYCTAEQEYYAQVPFVLWSGYINTVPRIFTTPTFMPALEALFPDRMVLTRLVRSVALPSETVWTRVKHLNHAYLLSAADRRVGIQLRFRDGVDMKNRMETLIDTRIIECLWKEGILPRFSQMKLKTAPEQSLDSIKRSPVIMVYIASLFRDLFDHISKPYLENPITVTGEDVSVVQLTSQQKQILHDENEDVQAFSEIFLLSFSDQLLITPLSTFGGLAQAYGAITPYFIEFMEDPPNGTKLEPCVRGRTVDVAQQTSTTMWDCPFQDPPVGNISDRAPYLRDVMDIELSLRWAGVRLVTNFDSRPEDA